MTTQQENEVEYWKHEVLSLGLAGFLKQRELDFNTRLSFFDGLLEEKGLGLDYGSALVSMFEFSNLKVEAFDPLMDEYNKIYKPNGKIIYYNNTEQMEAGRYDWILCMNVVDHTPDPQIVIDDLYRLLKPGGRLYFEVHFDPELYPSCHYSLWRQETVKKYLTKFKLVKEGILDGSVPNQQSYNAIYLK